MEAVLEGTLMLAMAASGLCMLALLMMLIVGRYQMHRKRRDSLLSLSEIPPPLTAQQRAAIPRVAKMPP